MTHPPSINVKICGGQATAIVVPSVAGNWVRSDILKRMATQPRRKSDSDIRKRRKATFRRNSFEATGKYLELNCHRDKGLGSCRHLFYITEDEVDFDVLLGTDMVTSATPRAAIVSSTPSSPRLAPKQFQTVPSAGNYSPDQKVWSWMMNERIG